MQLPTYNWTKNHLVKAGIANANSVWAFLASSSVSGICVVCAFSISMQYFSLNKYDYQCIAMQPADTVGVLTVNFMEELDCIDYHCRL